MNLVKSIQFLILSISFLQALDGYAQSASSNLFTNEISIGEQVIYELKVGATQTDDIAWPNWKDTIAKNIEIVEYSKIDTLIVNNKYQYTLQLSLTSFDTGVFVIPPAKFMIGDQAVETEAHILAVSAVAIDTTAAVKDIKKPYELPYTFEEIALLVAKYGGIAYVVLAVLAIMAYFLGKDRIKPYELEKVEPEIPIDEWVASELEKLEHEELWQSGLFKEYHTRISDITRTYLERKHNLAALESSTHELIQVIDKQNFSTDIKAELIHSLQISDLAKFAKAEPLKSENELVLSAIKKLIAQDIRIQQAQNKEGSHVE